MSFYPIRIEHHFRAPGHAVAVDGSDATAKAVSFTCGSVVEFSLSIRIDGGVIEAVTFRSNGCGYMIAAADAICEMLDGRPLAGMNGLADDAIQQAVEDSLGSFPAGRKDCLATCIEGIRSAFSAYRLARIEEFKGEKALVCTCFGVSEDEVETALADPGIQNTDDVARQLRAGSGCGSCRMLIQEMLDNRATAIND